MNATLYSDGSHEERRSVYGNGADSSCMNAVPDRRAELGREPDPAAFRCHEHPKAAASWLLAGVGHEGAERGRGVETCELTQRRGAE